MSAEFITRRAAREARIHEELEQLARQRAESGQVILGQSDAPHVVAESARRRTQQQSARYDATQLHIPRTQTPRRQESQRQAPQHRAPSSRANPKHALRSHQTEAARNNRSSKRRIFTATSVVSVVLLGTTALATVPANASPVNNGTTVYANQLLAAAKLPPYHASQSLSVSAEASSSQVDQTSFSSAIPAKSLTANNAPTPGQGSPTFTASGHANIDWAALVLSDAGLPVTANNVTVMLQWMDSENAPQSWYLRNNPLNNGLGSGGGAGFGSYPNLSVAAAYVAKQLDRSLFSGIADALAANSSPSVTAQAIMASPWATGHYGYGSHWHAVNVPVVTAPASNW